MQEAVEVLRRQADQGRQAVVARIVEIEGFSTRPGDDLVAVDDTGSLHGTLLAGLGNEELKHAASSLLSGKEASVTSLTLDIHDKQAASAGLACGGRAHLLLQPASVIPGRLWQLLFARAPAALITPLDGASPAWVVDREGRSWDHDAAIELTGEAASMLAAGRTDRRRVEHSGHEYLIEAWVPEPRLVVVGGGELVEAIRAQADLLGWETRSCTAADDQLGELLDWAGDTGALIVLSHDPHVDSPALAAGLRGGAAYVGALGSRATQARRTERLLESGVEQSDIDRIHRPIGLDLGGRRAPEVALAIVAEILAAHCGRDARPLAQRQGPIHG
ncbi:MAG TPA: XdhC family protein [Acidimicrobiales bacterium]